MLWTSKNSPSQGKITVKKGDIIRVPYSIEIDIPGKKWQEHFADVLKLFKVIDTPNNNRRFLAMDSKGKKYYLYELQIDSIVRRA